MADEVEKILLLFVNYLKLFFLLLYQLALPYLLPDPSDEEGSENDNKRECADEHVPRMLDSPNEQRGEQQCKYGRDKRLGGEHAQIECMVPYDEVAQGGYERDHSYGADKINVVGKGGVTDKIGGDEDNPEYKDAGA